MNLENNRASDLEEIVIHKLCAALITLTVLLVLLTHGDLCAAQTPGNWKADWEATQRAAEKEAKLVIYGPPGADQQKLYTDVFHQAFPKFNEATSRAGI